MPHDKTGSQVFGVKVELIHDQLVTKREAMRVMRYRLMGERQARASVNSYMAEGWPIPSQEGSAAALSDAFTHVNSLEARVLRQADRRPEASAENGRRGGRPKHDRR